MIIVTGGAGFIGSNIIRALNKAGYRDIIAVDNLKKGIKFKNLVDLHISDYLDKTEFIARIADEKQWGNVQAIFHQGACSDTTQWDGQYMMDNNYHYSKALLHYALNRKIPFLYASSAAVYGNRTDHFIEERCYECPINVYGYSKLLFDDYVRRILPQAQSPICGLRYFNVYGPYESHKGPMASVVFHLHQQIKRDQNPQLFVGSESFKRDFIFIDDAVFVNIWLWQQGISGIFNCGTGYAESFQTLGNAVTTYYPGYTLASIPFPEALKGHYQAFTQADLTHLRRVGYNKPFKTVAQGVKAYLDWLNCAPFALSPVHQ